MSSHLVLEDYIYIYTYIIYIYIYIYIVLDILEGIDVNETRHQNVYYLPLSAFFGLSVG